MNKSIINGILIIVIATAIISAGASIVKASVNEANILSIHRILLDIKDSINKIEAKL